MHPRPGILFLIVVAALGPPLRAAELTVHLTNLPATGTVAFVLFDSANAFGDLRDPAKVVTRTLDGRNSFRLENLSPGRYALLVYFDENGNGRLDANFIGIPLEPLGFSNGYRPKGPPNYNRAAVSLADGESRRIDVELFRPLGRRGRLGAGAGVVFRSQPYVGADGIVSRVIPALTYSGERLQVYGPRLQCGLFGGGRMRLAATGTYRIGAYEEDDSAFLDGMGDRKDTLMAGLALRVELAGGIDLALNYEHDLLGRIGGGTARLALNKSFQFGAFSVSPELGLNWLSPDLADYDFGVPPENATPARPACELDRAFNVEAGLGVFVEVTRDWLVAAGLTAELLDDAIADSPIVAGNHVLKGFATLAYGF